MRGRDPCQDTADDGHGGDRDRKEKQAGILEDPEGGAAVLYESEFENAGNEGNIRSVCQCADSGLFCQLVKKNEQNDQDQSLPQKAGIRLWMLLCIIHRIT